MTPAIPVDESFVRPHVPPGTLESLPPESGILLIPTQDGTYTYEVVTIATCHSVAVVPGHDLRTAIMATEAMTRVN